MSKKRFWLIFLSAVLLVSALTVSVFASNGNTAEPYMKIVEKSVSLEDSIYMYLAAETKNVTGDVYLLAFDKPQTAYTKENAIKQIPVEYVDGNGRSIFFYRDIIAQKMTDTVYFAVYTVKDGKDYYSAPQKFSVVEYVNVINTMTSDTLLKELTQNMLNYGASAQKYFKYRTDFLATDPVHKIKVVGGTLDDGFRVGVYKEGTTVTITADAPAENMEFSHFKNSKGDILSTDQTYTVTVTENETYTAVYKKTGPAAGKLAYTKNADGKTCTVTGLGTYANTDLLIPSAIDGYTVTAIADSAFYDCIDITSVTVPGTVKEIPYDAFGGCTSVTRVTLLEGVDFIGDYAFELCEKLQSVTLPSSLTGIGESAFESCFALRDVVIPEKVTTIGESAFYECESLAFVKIPNGVTEIGNYTFDGCINLQQVILGNRTARIGDFACKGCSNLQSIYMPSTVTKIGNAVFRDCPKLVDVFYDGTKENFDAVHVGSFNDKLQTANLCFYSETKPTAGGDFWHYVNGVITLWEKDYAFLYQVNADNTCTITGLVGSLPARLEIPKNIDGYAVTEIGPKAFDGCTGLKELTIPPFIRKMERDSLTGCTTLQTVRYNSSYTPGYGKSILDEPSIKTVIFGGTAVPAHICSGCFNLFHIEILDSNTAIGESAFFYCYNVKDIKIPESVTTIDKGAFSSCQGLISVRIPSGVTEIADRLFDGAQGLSSVDIPDGVTKIGASAFVNCSGLRELHLPDSVQTIGDSAFSSCTGLKTVTVPSSVKTVGNYAFYNCYHLQSIVFSEGVETIGNYALESCSVLQHAVLPKSLVSIGRNVFSSDGNAVAYYGGTAADWKNIQFGGAIAEVIPANRLYYFSETQPTTVGNFWHYVNGTPTKW